MRIQITLTEENYDETKRPFVVDTVKLENNWIEISLAGTEYSVPGVDFAELCRAYLASLKE